MTARQFDRPIPAKAKLTPAHQPATPDTKVAHAANHDPRSGVVRAAGGVPRPKALAAALDQAGGGRLARAGLLQLQRQYGNRYVQLVISQVRANPAVPPSKRGEAQPTAVCPAGGEVDASLHRTINTARGGGQPLDRRVSAQLGQALGTDFGHVKVHTDQRADSLSQALNASAFTVASDIFFGANRYNPSTVEGKRLLAHELTHVVQQGASSRPVPQLRLAPANDTHERAADRVADVVCGIGAHPPAHLRQDQTVHSAAPVHANGNRHGACPLAPPSIQRKVYVGGKQLLKEPGGAKGSRQEEGKGERSVQNMIVDNKSRYFKNKQEVYDYADEKTETIGYVEQGEGAWIRLKDNELLVLGEKHPKEGRGPGDEAALVDIVKAVGTKRFMWEAYTELPPWTAEDAPLRQTMQKRQEAKEETFRIAHLTGHSHEAESFFPKVWRGLAGMNFEYNNDLVSTEIEWQAFQWAILAAAEAKDSAPALHEVYKGNKEALDLAVSTEWPARQQWVEAVGVEQAKASLKAMHNAVAAHVTETRKAVPDRQKKDFKDFNKGWHRAKDDYSKNPDDPKMQADKARDFSMYQHILQAKKKKYLLYGLGYLHGQRLQGLLKSQRIKYMKVGDFIEQQRKKYPQG
jgi:hypothetical protein